MSASLPLRSGCNPHQSPARASVDASTFPLSVRNGEPGFINLLDALVSWQLVRDLSAATGGIAAASFKHVTPAGVALSAALDEVDVRACHVGLAAAALSPVSTAYVRARGGDRLSSYGDWVAVSAPVDRSLATVLAGEVSDGIIAPSYEPDALEILAAKKRGAYCVLEMDPSWRPDPVEVRTVFGITIEQPINAVIPNGEHLANPMTSTTDVPDHARRDLLLGLVTVKHAVSNAVALCHDGQIVGLAAGQQSRIDATRLACDRADRWWLRRHPAALDLPLREGLSNKQRDNAIDAYLHGITDTVTALFTEAPDPLASAARHAWLEQRPPLALASDGAIPFRDNVDRAAASGVRWIAQPGGSARDAEVVAAADAHGISMLATGLRLFTH